MPNCQKVSCLSGNIPSWPAPPRFPAVYPFLYKCSNLESIVNWGNGGKTRPGYCPALKKGLNQRKRMLYKRVKL
jgi:hypothetical protein